MKFKLIFKNIFFLLIFIIRIVATQASMHISESPDEDFITLGKEFPSVGYFYKAENDAVKCGSGTLINTGIPQLEGRVVVTAAHVLEKDSSQFIFSLNGQNSTGKVIIYPEYENVEKLDLHRMNGLDIGLFYMDTPFKGPSADLDFNLSYEHCLGSYLTTVGYGLTGHVDGLNRIYDNQRRASWSFADPLLNNWNLNPHFTSTEQIYKLSKDNGIDIELLLHPKAVLSTGDNQEYDISYSPIGVSSLGDSGGGVFTTGRKLVALVKSGELPPQNVAYRITSSCYRASKPGFDNVIKVWEKQKTELLENGGELPWHFSLGYGFPMNLEIMPDDDINRYLTPRVPKRSHEHTGYKVFINYHQNWLKEKFDELAKLSY